MPVEVAKYKCSFCGYRESADIEQVEAHEVRCMMNPDANGCRTCSSLIAAVGWIGKGGRWNGVSERCAKGISLISRLKTNCPDWAST